MSGRRLNGVAREALRAANVTPREWTRRYFADSDSWQGDACGCPDDRCIGHHHDEEDACGCLPALLTDLLTLDTARTEPKP